MTTARKRLGSGDDPPESDDNERSESFADLVGDARPIDRGPARVSPKRSKPLRAARGRDAKSARGASRFRWPDPKDRHRAGIEGVSNAQLAALGRGEPEPAERIDLHGARREAAQRLLAKRLESARAQGLDCVLVIHGRGQRSPTDEAVLRDALPDWLTRGASAKHVLAFAPAPDRLGGFGATLVQLRRAEHA